MASWCKSSLREMLESSYHFKTGTPRVFLPILFLAIWKGKKRKKERERGYRHGEPTHRKGLDDQLHCFYTTASQRKSFTINSPCLCLEATPGPFLTATLDSGNGADLGFKERLSMQAPPLDPVTGFIPKSRIMKCRFSAASYEPYISYHHLQW